MRTRSLESCLNLIAAVPPDVRKGSAFPLNLSLDKATPGQLLNWTLEYGTLKLEVRNLCGNRQTGGKHPPPLPRRHLAPAGCRFLYGIEVDDFDNRWEGNFYNLAISAFHFDAGSGKRLRGFHAAHDAADALPVNGDDFNIVFAV